jgi:sulfide:quinone oxidoreductase
MVQTDPREVLIVGAGVGGLETALALRALAPGSVRVRMLAPERHFTYRPLAVGEPFGRSRTVQVELSRVAEERGFELIRDALDRIDPGAHRVHTQDGRRLDYGSLVLALGARPVAAVDGALTFRGPRDVPRVSEALQRLRTLERPRITFTAGTSATWTLPLYELALLTADWAAREGIDAEITVVTSEAVPLEDFGEVASADVAALLARRGIAVRAGSVASHVSDGRLWIPMEGGIPADLVVALPALIGHAVRGLPLGRSGFVAVDEFCRARDLDDIYVIGDMASHRVKQGGLAAQQADCAAAAIAHAAGEPVAVEPYRPVLRGMLLTGEAPLYLRNPPAGIDGEGPSGDGDRTAPWWPPHKIAGAHLAPYLATHADLLVAA